MSQQGTAGRKKQSIAQAPIGLDTGLSNASQQGVDNSLAGLDTAFAPEVGLDPSVAPTFVDTGAQESLLAPGTLDPLVNTAVQEPVVAPGAVVPDLGLGVEQILGRETALFNPFQAFGSNKRGRGGLGGGSSISGGK